MLDASILLPLTKPAARALLRRVLGWLGEPLAPPTDPRQVRLTWYHSRRVSRRRRSLRVKDLAR